MRLMAEKSPRRKSYDCDHEDLEDKVGPVNVSLYKDGSLEQEFTLEFVDDHEVVIERKIE